MDNIDWGLIASGMPTPGFNAPAAGFADRFAGGPGLPRPVGAPQPPMIDPDVLAKQFAARGVPPPPVDAAPPIIPNPGLQEVNPGAMQAWRQDSDTMSGVGGPNVGAALTGNAGPTPMNIQSDAQKASTGPTDVSAQSKQPGSFADALKGVKAPPNPELQRIGTPAAPKPHTTIKGGDIIALLQSLGIGAPQAPVTLGAAIRK